MQNVDPYVAPIEDALAGLTPRQTAELRRLYVRRDDERAEPDWLRALRAPLRRYY